MANTNKNRLRSAQSSAKMAIGRESIKRYFYAKEWDTSFRTNTLNQEEVLYRINNNLPLDDLYSTLDNKYKRTGKHIVNGKGSGRPKKNVNDETM